MIEAVNLSYSVNENTEYAKECNELYYRGTYSPKMDIYLDSLSGLNLAYSFNYPSCRRVYYSYLTHCDRNQQLAQSLTAIYDEMIRYCDFNKINGFGFFLCELLADDEQIITDYVKEVACACLEYILVQIGRFDVQKRYRELIRKNEISKYIQYKIEFK